MLSFRTVPTTDAAAAALLAQYFAYRRASFPTPDGYHTVLPTPEQFVAPHGVFLLVTLDGADVGCGGIRWLGQTRYEVKHLWVQPGLRGTGIGKALLAELERRAVILGATEVVLDTNSSLGAAGGLYQSSGYQPIEAYNDNPNATNWYRKILL